MNMKRFLIFSIVVMPLLAVIVGCSNDPGSREREAIKTIGIIGGISWVSSNEYYRLMNQMVNERLGGLHSAPILMYSIEFDEFSQQERLASKGNWSPLKATMIDAAQRLKRGGVDFIVIASNTMNSTAGLIEEKVGIPVLHIADAVGVHIKSRGITRIALLGTRFTMEEDFYKKRLEKFGLKVVIPNEDERVIINSVIFDQLCKGIFTDASRNEFVKIINRLVREEHAQGVILGCTEIPLLINQKDVAIPVFNSMEIHAEAAVKRAIGK